jgi:hypothetical protein
MHKAFGDLFFALQPDAPPSMLVYAADIGEPSDPNIEIQAAIFDANWEIVGEPITRRVAKVCLPDLGA